MQIPRISVLTPAALALAGARVRAGGGGYLGRFFHGGIERAGLPAQVLSMPVAPSLAPSPLRRCGEGDDLPKGGGGPISPARLPFIFPG